MSNRLLFDIFFHIADYFTLSQLLHVGLVCRRWQVWRKRPVIWERRVQTLKYIGNSLIDTIFKELRHWEKTYQKLYITFLHPINNWEFVVDDSSNLIQRQVTLLSSMLLQIPAIHWSLYEGLLGVSGMIGETKLFEFAMNHNVFLAFQTNKPVQSFSIPGGHQDAVVHLCFGNDEGFIFSHQNTQKRIHGWRQLVEQCTHLCVFSYGEDEWHGGPLSTAYTCNVPLATVHWGYPLKVRKVDRKS